MHAASLLSLALMGACGDPEAASNPPPSRPVVATEIEIGTDAWQRLSSAERAERIHAWQASAGPEFAVREIRPGVLAGAQRRMALQAEFGVGRASIRTASNDDATQRPVELAATAWGCAGSMSELSATEPVLGDSPATVSFRHTGFDEWYTLGPAGIEQGFTVRELPECVKRGQALKIRLRFSDVEGAIAEVETDGSGAVLTAPGHRGVHYGEPFARDATGAEHAARITSSDALSLEIDVRHATLPLEIDPLIWEIQQNIRASDFKPASFWPNDYFGHAVAVSGDTALIGTYSDNDRGEDAGAAYVFVRVPPSKPGLRARWAPQQKLTASDAASGDSFGKAVAISGNTALVGAEDKSSGAGAVYVFVRNGTVWSEQAKLVPSDASPQSGFGAALALLGDTALIGAPRQSTPGLSELGAAYAFGRAGTSWAQQRKFVPPLSENKAGLHFGAAVAVSSSSVAIGRDNLNRGGVDWFTGAAGAWSSGSTGVGSSVPHFGSALAMNDVTTAIGAYGDSGKASEAGAVTLTSNSLPHVLTRLTASDAAATDHFGYSLALSGSTLLVGAPGVDTAPGNGQCSTVADSGAAYVFTQSGDVFTQQKKLGAINIIIEAPPLPPCADPGMGIGTSVATDGALVLLGAPFRADWGVEAMPNTGAVFEHEYAATNASPCTQNSECISGYCVEGVCCKSACNGPCLSCLAALKDPALSFGGDWVTGVCGEVAANTDPKNGCVDQGTFCGTTDVCSGYGACASAHPPGTQCGAGASSTCVSPTSTAANAVCVNNTCASYFTFDCDPGYLCKNGFCKTNCSSDSDCDDSKGFICQSGLCKPDTATGEGGSGGEGGAATLDSAGAGGDSGLAGALQGGEAGAMQAGAAGEAMESGGSGGTLPSAGAGSAGKVEAGLECIPACPSAMICDHQSGECLDRLVTACAYRALGHGGARASWLALFALGALTLARRRRMITERE